MILKKKDKTQMNKTVKLNKIIIQNNYPLKR